MLEARKTNRAMMLGQPVMPVRVSGAVGNQTRLLALNAHPVRHGPTRAVERFYQVSINQAYFDRELRSAASLLKQMVRQNSTQSFHEMHRKSGN